MSSTSRHSLKWKCRFGCLIPIHSDDAMFSKPDSLDSRLRGNDDTQLVTSVHGAVRMKWYYALGAGVGSRSAGESLKKRSVQWYCNFFDSKRSSYLNSGGNGAAMRIQPHVWSAPKNRKYTDILKDVIRNTITTHGHCRALIGATFHAMCLLHTIRRRSVPNPSDWYSILEYLEDIPNTVRSDNELSSLWLPIWERETGRKYKDAITECIEEFRADLKDAESAVNSSHSPTDIRSSYATLVKKIGGLKNETVGTATKTALLASYISYVYQDHPHEGIVTTVNLLGSDTDTIATMAGALLGIIARSDPPEQVHDLDYLIPIRADVTMKGIWCG